AERCRAIHRVDRQLHGVLGLAGLALHDDAPHRTVGIQLDLQHGNGQQRLRHGAGEGAVRIGLHETTARVQAELVPVAVPRAGHGRHRAGGRRRRLRNGR
ncbi:MAG: hypothetical protein ACK55I_25775, partial [bacterium]